MLRRFTSSSAGKIKYGLLLSLLVFLGSFEAAQGQTNTTAAGAGAGAQELTWDKFQRATAVKRNQDYINGLSYVISGSLALIGGQIGQQLSDDPLEKGVYTIFQSIGIASIGYGGYTWKIGGDERLIYDTLANSTDLKDKDKITVLRSYYEQRKERERSERIVKAVTHALIAALNIYNATQQENASVKNALYFVGGVNALATISFTF